MRFRRLPLLVVASAAITILWSTTALAASGVGYDVSYPQCQAALPGDAAFAIVGVSDGAAYGANPCLAAQYGWALGASSRPGFYMNTGNPGAAAHRANWYSPFGPLGCSPLDEAACAYNYGYNNASAAFDYASSQVGRRAATRGTWWLDVETANSWSADQGLNVAAIQGSLDFLSSTVVDVGLYSTGYQWAVITGGASFPWLPNWVAGAGDPDSAAALCYASFAGGPVRYVQYGLNGLDANYAC